jgi:hypothetical protein
MASKNPAASTARTDIKIVELATELGVDPREVVAAAKDMAMENAKVPASWVTGGQADRLRARFGGNQDLKELAARRQRAAQIVADNQPSAPEPPAPPPQPVLGKKTYEKDRRNVFGVVATPAGVRVEPKPVEKPKPAQAAAAPAATEPAKHNLVVQLPEVKKFIGVQVPEPVRREPQAADPRFGVVAPAPVEERPAVSTAPAQPVADLWGKLNDGRPTLDLTTTAPSAPKLPETPADEPATPEPLSDTELKEISGSAEVPAAEAAPAAAPAQAVPELRAEEELEDDDSAADDKEKVFAPPPPRIHEVPLKRAPAHKAFGAKRKLKHKHHKVIVETKAHKPEKKVEKHAHKPHAAEPAKAAHKAHEPHGHKTKKEGLLSRLARRLLGK